ncbi:hypothetical protein HY404_03580 [Candidatus Microgenomates bacterium]|nr:hypothetical protein [Candidatus Microgenomates bacterium]
MNKFSIFNSQFSINSGMTLPEFLGVCGIIIAILLVALFNFQDSKVKSQDEQRKANASAVVHALEKYQKDFNKFPRSQDGKILACGDPKNLRPCEWGFDKLVDLRDPTYPPYLDPIPLDPRQGQGNSFYYLSDGYDIQIFAHLVRMQDPARSSEIEKWQLACGREICNYGITSSIKPVKKLLKVE